MDQAGLVTPGTEPAELYDEIAMHNLAVGILLFLSLGLDTFSVAAALGLSGLTRADTLRVAVSFALAEGLMPLVGFVAGRSIAQSAGDLASYLAVTALLAVGAYTLYEALHEEERDYRLDSPWKLVTLSLSVSLDELAIGFSLGLVQVPILLALGYIALQAFLATMAGVAAGRFASRLVTDRAELLSGIVLTGLGIFLLLQKLVGQSP